MPQTSEHLAILEHLGVPGGNPGDHQVRPGRARLARAGAARAGRAAGGSPSRVRAAHSSSRPGRGRGSRSCDRLIAERATTLDRLRHGDLFRLPIDRVFSLAGVGTVVTGTAWSGRSRDAATRSRCCPAARREGPVDRELRPAPSSEASRGYEPRWASPGIDREEVQSRGLCWSAQQTPWAADQGARRRAGAGPTPPRPTRGPADAGPRASRHGGGHGPGASASPDRARRRRACAARAGSPAGGAWRRPLRASELQPGHHDRRRAGARSAAATARPRGRPELRPARLPDGAIQALLQRRPAGVPHAAVSRAARRSPSDARAAAAGASELREVGGLWIRD